MTSEQDPEHFSTAQIVGRKGEMEAWRPAIITSFASSSYKSIALALSNGVRHTRQGEAFCQGAVVDGAGHLLGETAHG